MADKNPAFATKPGDPKDVSWGLTTADTCWKRGERGEALKWLRRAVEAASEAELDERALELAKVAADLATHIGSMAPPENVATSTPAPTIPRATPVSVIPRATPLGGKPVERASPAKKADRKSITNEAAREKARVPSPAAPIAASLPPRPLAKPEEKPKPEEKTEEKPPAARKKAASRADRGETARRLSRTDEIDEWPTEVVPGEALPPSLEVAPAAGGRAVHATQAIRVLVW